MAALGITSYEVETSDSSLATGNELAAGFVYHMPKADQSDPYCEGSIYMGGRCGWLYYVEIYRGYFNGLHFIIPLVYRFEGRSGIDNDVSDMWVRNNGPVPDRFAAFSPDGQLYNRWLVGFWNTSQGAHDLRYNYYGYQPDSREAWTPGKWRLDPQGDGNYNYGAYPPPGIEGESRDMFQIHGGSTSSGADRIDSSGSAGCIRLRQSHVADLRDRWQNLDGADEGYWLWPDYTSEPDCPACEIEAH